MLALPPRLVPRWAWRLTCQPLNVDDGTRITRAPWKMPTVVPLPDGDAVLTLWFDGGLQWVPCRRTEVHAAQVVGQVVTYRARWLNFLMKPGISIADEHHGGV